MERIPERILMVHNFYQYAGGEDEVYRAESALLSGKGHKVFNFEADNKKIQSINPLRLFSNTIWNPETVQEINKIIRQEKIELIHCHNTFPLISPSIYYAAGENNIPVVQTIHNFRLICLNSYLYREGKICEDCLGKFLPWPGVFHSCYRNNPAASFGVAAMLVSHRLLHTYTHKVNKYIALSDFSKRKLIQSGLPEEKIAVKPNFITPDPGIRENQGNYALFIGRLDPTKGINTLVNAWGNLSNIKLMIAGDGPLYDNLLARTKTNSDIHMLGYAPKNEVIKLLKEARFLIFPSELFENCPMVILEAYACGIPVLAPAHGSIQEMVIHHKTGVLYRPGDLVDLSNKIQWCWQNIERMEEFGKNARKVFEEKYNQDSNYRSLLSIYASVM